MTVEAPSTLSRIQATVAEGDVTTVVPIPPASLLAYEREKGVGIGVLAISGGMEWFMWVTHHALTTRHGEERSFDDWVAAIDAIDDTTADAIRPPTGATGRSSEPSPSSRSGPPTPSKSSSTSTRTSKKRSSGK